MVTFTILGQGGHHHVNEEYGEYWIKKFESIEFKYEEAITQKSRKLLPAEGFQGSQFREKGLISSKMKTV